MQISYNIMIFTGLQDFTSKLNPYIVAETRALYPNISGICDAFVSAQKGCNCSKKRRMELVISVYKNMAERLIPEEKTWLKNLFGQEEIIFQENGQNFLVF